MNWKIWQYFQYFTEHIYLFLTSEKLGRCREGTRQRVASCRCRTSICTERTLKNCTRSSFSHPALSIDRPFPLIRHVLPGKGHPTRTWYRITGNGRTP